MVSPRIVLEAWASEVEEAPGVSGEVPVSASGELHSPLEELLTETLEELDRAWLLTETLEELLSYNNTP